MEKTKEIVIDFLKGHSKPSPMTIYSDALEKVSSTKFLGVHITDASQVPLLCFRTERTSVSSHHTGDPSGPASLNC